MDRELTCASGSSFSLACLYSELPITWHDKQLLVHLSDA